MPALLLAAACGTMIPALTSGRGTSVAAELGVSDGAAQLIVFVEACAVLVAAIAVAALLGSRRVDLRAFIAGSIVALGVLCIGTSAATTTIMVGLVVGAYGLVGGVMWATQVPSVLRLEPNARREAAMLGAYFAALFVGAVVGGLLSIVPTAHWQTATLVTGLLIMAVGVTATVIAAVGRAPLLLEAAPETGQPGIRELTQMLRTVVTARWALVIYGSAGAFLIPAPSFLFTALGNHLSLEAHDRAALLVAVGATGAILLVLGGRAIDRLRANGYRVTMRVAAVVQLLALTGVGGAFLVPSASVAIIVFAAAMALFGVAMVAVTVAYLDAIPLTARAYGMAAAGVAVLSVGGWSGQVFFETVEAAFGPHGAAAAVGLTAFVGAVLMAFMAASADADVEARAKDAASVSRHAATGTSAKRALLACHGVDFSYGHLQVLFGVDFAIHDGEMLALLGTNGAGKSTLLRVLSGLGIPQRGRVTLAGRDITYVAAERRVSMGVVQVPGGKATFGPLSVLDSLRVHGYLVRRDRRALNRAIDECFEVFPALAARRHVLASALSGGEQQMLALSKALILRPRVLCIDELALGLSPKIVGELLTTVHRINATGVAIVIVEQSVNIALSVAHRAYFMEKGEIRFEGPAAQLSGRADLLRSVFLSGAASVVGAPSRTGYSDTASDAPA